MKTKLKDIEKIVESILEDTPCTRDSDKLLYLAVLSKQGYDINIPLKDYLRSDYFPNYDSVSRCRRKIQEKRPELSHKNVVKLRREIENDYINYAVNSDQK